MRRIVWQVGATVFVALAAAANCLAAPLWFPGIPNPMRRKPPSAEAAARPVAPRVSKYVVVDPAPYRQRQPDEIHRPARNRTRKPQPAPHAGALTQASASTRSPRAEHAPPGKPARTAQRSGSRGASSLPRLPGRFPLPASPCSLHASRTARCLPGCFAAFAQPQGPPAHDVLWTQHAWQATAYPWGWFGARSHAQRSGTTSLRGLHRDAIIGR